MDLVAVRDLVLKANPDVIPEMIAGDSFDAMMQSVGPARDAYKRIVDGMQSQQGIERAARAGWWWPASVRRQHRGAVAVGARSPRAYASGTNAPSGALALVRTLTRQAAEAPSE